MGRKKMIAGRLGARANAGELRGFVERFERLTAEIAELRDARAAVMAEAKAVGYVPKVMRIVLRERSRGAEELAEERALAALYRDALGMEGTPLDDWAEGAAPEAVAAVRHLYTRTGTGEAPVSVPPAPASAPASDPASDPERGADAVTPLRRRGRPPKPRPVAAPAEAAMDDAAVAVLKARAHRARADAAGASDFDWPGPDAA